MRQFRLLMAITAVACILVSTGCQKEETNVRSLQTTKSTLHNKAVNGLEAGVLIRVEEGDQTVNYNSDGSIQSLVCSGTGSGDICSFDFTSDLYDPEYLATASAGGPVWYGLFTRTKKKKSIFLLVEGGAILTEELLDQSLVTLPYDIVVDSPEVLAALELSEPFVINQEPLSVTRQGKDYMIKVK